MHMLLVESGSGGLRAYKSFARYGRISEILAPTLAESEAKAQACGSSAGLTGLIAT